MPTIYLICTGKIKSSMRTATLGVCCEAVTEDGHSLAETISKTLAHAARDLRNKACMRAYEEHCPDGFTIVDLLSLEDPATHPGIQKAITVHNLRAEHV